MSAIFFIGDLHFGHQKVSDIRGFPNTDDHDIAIIRQWRKQVKADDLVYVMGDISAGGREVELDALEILRVLPGRKRLISGNHDSTAGQHKTVPSAEHRALIAEVFERVSDHGFVRYEGIKILLSHYPYWVSGDGPGRNRPARHEQWRLPDLGEVLIHAHTHWTHPTSGSMTGREICVSWDAWKRLVDMGDIAKLVKEMVL